MAVNVDTNNLPEKGEGKAKNPETKFIKAGNRLARFVSYVELGKHYQMFQGAKAKYESGKRAGQEKPAVLHCALTFEFPDQEYTGDYPLCISTTRRMASGEFFDAVVVPDSLADGTMSKAYALRTRFMKYLGALQVATGKAYTNFADFAKIKAGVMINVTNKLGAKDEQTGLQPTYANMKPEGIVAPQFEHPTTGEVEYLEVPEPKGEYCTSFEWDAPTAEAWTALPPFYKETIKAAVDFPGSPIDLLLKSNPELEEALADSEDQDQSVSTPTAPPVDMTKEQSMPV